MKKNTIKAFTLVEMLIVIVIIGILIASLMPRMQTAQGRARDVARKNDLAQIQTAIITSQQDRGDYPCMGADGCNADKRKAEDGITVNLIQDDLIAAGMTQVPGDPNRSNFVNGMSDATGEGQYLYMVTDKNGVDNGGFILMAKTEVEGGSNWIVCDEADSLPKGFIQKGEDLSNITTCSRFNQVNDPKDCAILDNGECNYSSVSELRYILVF